MRLGNVEVGAREPLFLIAGPCVIESAALCEEVAGRMVEITRALGIPYIFKASYDKANRSSRSSFRGPGIEAGLKVLEDVRAKFGVPVLTDVHEDTPLSEVAAVVDVLQTPAFLCRQTNFIVAAASQGKPVNIKKGQFLSPWEMQNVVDKARSTGNPGIMVCSANSYRCLRALLSRRAWRVFSWKPIPIPPKPCLTARMLGRCRAWPHCSKRCSSSTVS